MGREESRRGAGSAERCEGDREPVVAVAGSSFMPGPSCARTGAAEAQATTKQRRSRVTGQTSVCPTERCRPWRRDFVVLGCLPLQEPALRGGVQRDRRSGHAGQIDLPGALDASMYREFKAAQKNKYIGLAMDVGLVLGAFLGAFGYLVEIDSICLIDQMTGVREQLIQEALERSQGVIPGISFEAEVPACQARFGIWILPLLFTIITLFFIYNVRVWGLPLVLVASGVVLYTVGTSLVWIFDLSDNNFLLTKLGADGGDATAAPATAGPC